MRLKGQVFIITVFALMFALFSIFLLLAPIKDKIIRIKEMEFIYQAVANGEKGLETSLLDVFKGINLNLRKQSTTYQTSDCAGLMASVSGFCTQLTYEPIIDDLWKNQDKFRADNFILKYSQDNEISVKMKTISDGFIGRIVRTVILGSGR